MPSRALLTEVQTIPNADIVQALANLKIVATSGITTTLPTTSSTLAILAGQTFTGTQAFSGVINIVATTSTTGQITQAGTRVMHFYTASGFQNIFIGAGAGSFNATNGSNVGIGRAALSGLVGGSNNVCIGDASGYQITSGTGNMLIGQGAGVNLISGSSNCAIGVSSLTTASATSNNTAVGYQSLGSSTGSSSTGIGHNSGYSSTSSNGTYIGQSAGYGASTVGGLLSASITSGANCTMLGQGSGSTSATGNYRTAIGSDSRCQSDNSIKLGRDTLDKVIIPSWSTAPTTSLSAGMLYYDTTLAKLRVYTTAWETITSI